MTWFKVDDDLFLHPKALVAGNAAMGLWVRAGSYSMAKLTEGYISFDVVRSLGNKGLAERLVTAGFWYEVSGGYQFHQWHEDPKTGSLRQPHAEEVEARKELGRKRQADWRKRHRQDSGKFGATREPPPDE